MTALCCLSTRLCVVAADTTNDASLRASLGAYATLYNTLSLSAAAAFCCHRLITSLNLAQSSGR